MALGESFDALQVQDDEEKRSGEEPNDKVKDDEENDDDKEEEEEDDSQLSSESQRQLGESRLVELSGVQTESRAAQLRTLVESDQSVGLKVNSALEEKHVEAEFKERNGMPNQELLESAALNCAEPQIQSELKSSVCPTSLSDLSPTSVTQSISSAASPTLPEQRMSPSKCVPEADQQGSSGLKSKTLVVVPSVKTPVPDGYNWRKYGQKQVKSPKGSRSYYRCTYSDCFAKKIECSDHSGNVIEIVNKGTHTHDPPRKNSSSRQNKVALTVGSTSLNGGTEHPIRTLRDSDPATLSSEPVQEVSTTLDRKRQNSSGSKGDIEVKEEQFNEPEPKRRLKKIHLECSETILKPEKKPKFIVHAAGDVGISGDGYRWRKYGQKMVKGNSHPRNYYRCTSAGCPARKHIETAVNNTNAVIITYKGVHDHDMPVPKKRHGPPSASLVAAATAAPTSMHNLQLKITNTSQNQVTSTQWSVGKEGELTSETLELGGEKEKAIESARTLLSIGFEIKPC